MPTRKLTQRIVREFVRTLGGTFIKTHADDYKVAFGNHRSDSREEYFTNDLDDAIGTARCMKGSHPDIELAEHNLKVALFVPYPMKCDQCEMLSINGVPCHEHGCPNTRSRWDGETGEWVRQYECSHCGIMVDRGLECCVFEETEESEGE